jgi:SPP1 gp7 family putative phage head morphogenesis protein
LENKIDSSQQDVSLPEFIGATGTTIYNGYYSEEKLTELLGINGLETYEEMRRGDCQIKMILNAIKGPIKSAQFEFDNNESDETNEDISDYLKFNWFNNPNFEFKKFVSECLTYLDFGFSIHEFILSYYEHLDLGNLHILGGLGFRKQNTITRFLVNKKQGFTGIVQQAFGDTTDNKSIDVTIPREKLIVFTNEEEGDNYEGISLLRACYGPWFRKNLYLKLNAIGNEKASIGIPIGKYPKGAETSSQKTSFINALANFSIHESAFIAFPDGYDVKIEKIDFDSEKLLASIQYEDSQMAKSILLQFLELGQNGNGGSYALGADQSDIALSSFQFIGDLICSKINQLSKKLVEMNYGPVEKIPLCKVSGINSKAGTELANIVGTLIDKRVIKADQTLETYFRKIYNLPMADETPEMETKEAAGENNKDVPPIPDNIIKNSEIKLAESDSFSSYRELTIYEKPINFAEIKKDMDFERDRLLRTLKARIVQINEKTLRDLEIILRKNQENRSGVMIDFEVNTSSLKKVLIESMSDIVATGSNEAKKELETKLGTEIKLAESWKRNLEFLPKQVKNALLLQANMQSKTVGDRIKKIIAFGVMAGDDFKQPDKQIISDIEDELDKYVNSPEIMTAANTITSQCINRGRQGYLFDSDNLESIQAFQYSAVIDDRTTDLCLSLDGQIFKPDDIESQRFMPPNHYNCRSILVPITINEKKPKVTGLDIDPTNPILIEEYKKMGKAVPNLADIKKQRNL